MVGLVDGNNFFVSCERVVDPRLEGRPVAVLSNNDGCCVSRSNEFKALGIPMGTPYFQLRDREASGELVFRSSNYELYGDMSRRIVSILREEAVDVEQYSIDEAFISPPSFACESGGDSLREYGVRLRSKILQWVGIPCGVGFAATKTLAKIANHIAKKRKEGVFAMPEDAAPVLASLPPEEVWGVGRRLAPKLRAARILTALHLRDASDSLLRSIGGVTLLRTSMELRGVQCHEERDYDANPDSVTCSRSFGEPVTTQEALMESIASFAAQAAAKLRRHGLVASGCNVYAQMGGAYDGRWVERTVAFARPTDATNEIMRAIRREASDALFLKGERYRKSGVVFFGLESADAMRQGDLFESAAPVGASKLYKAVDAINARYGKHMVHAAAEGIGDRSWKMKRAKLSKRATTNWNELITVR